VLKDGAAVADDSALPGVDLVAAVLHSAFLVPPVAWGYVKAAIGDPKPPPGARLCSGLYCPDGTRSPGRRASNAEASPRPFEPTCSAMSP
jgi:hypothetical protein